MFTYLVLILSVVITAKTTANAEFLQDISFKGYFADVSAGSEVSTKWEKLPMEFASNTSTTPKKGRFVSTERCMYTIGSSGTIYGAAVKETVPSMESMESPYEAWATIGDSITGGRLILDADGTYTNATSGAEASTRLFVLTEDNVGVVTLSGSGCGTISHVVPQLLAPEGYEWGTITAADLSVSLQTLFVGSWEHGALQVDVSSTGTAPKVVKPVHGDTLAGPVKTLKWVEQWSSLFISHPVALYTVKMEVASTSGQPAVLEVNHEWVGGVLGTRVVDMDFDPVNDYLWLAETEALHKLSKDGMYYRYGWQQGAPMYNITSVVLANGMVYAGSDTGLGMSRVSASACPKQLDTSLSGFHSESSEKESDPWRWQYYFNARYLPSNAVLALVADKRPNSKHSVLAMTDVGLGYIRAENMNLDTKAAAMQTFQKPRHDRHGLMAEVSLTEFGDLDSYVQTTNDNDGLWTSMSTMGHAYRYAISKQDGGKGDPEAKKLAWEGFLALERLSTITGAYPAFTARSLCQLDVDINCPEVDPECVDDCWYNSPTDGWNYKGDTSSDELTGHFAAYALLYDVVAETQAEKSRVLKLYEGLLMGIIDNNLYFIQPATNKRTLWGFWNPKELNYEPEHYSERGTNSLEILAWLTQAYSITGNRKYKETYEDLVKHHKYVENTYNVKIDSNVDENHSDTELIMLAYHSLFYASQRLGDEHPRKQEVREMVEPMLPSLRKTWILVAGELSPLWLGIYAGTAQQTHGVNDVAKASAVASLQRWALDFIQWEIKGTQRIDLDINEHFTARYSDVPIMRHIRPPSEREASEWNNDPFMVNPGGNGKAEYEPGTWLFPYYIMKYNGLI